MRKTISVFLALLIYCAVLTNAVLAFQANRPVSFNATPISYPAADWTSSLIFPTFDTALETLLHADLNITSKIKNSLTVINNTLSSSKGNAKTHVAVTLVDPWGLIILSQDVYSSTFSYQLIAETSTASELMAGSDSNTDSNIDLTILDKLKETGSVSIFTSSLSESGITNNGKNTLVREVTQADTTEAITHQHIFVPEPSCILAFLTGLTVSIAILKPSKKTSFME